MKADEVKAAIHKYHGMHLATGEWTAVNEAFSGPMSAGGGVDVMAFGAWRTAKVSVLDRPGVYKAKNPYKVDTRWPVVAYEVKVSRADFKREIYGHKSKRGRGHGAWPAKAASAIERSHYFVFATPMGLLREDEVERRAPDGSGSLFLPEGSGLVEVRPSGSIKVRVKATPTPARSLTAGEVGEVIRHALQPNKERTTVQTIAFIRNAAKQAEKRYHDERAFAKQLVEFIVKTKVAKDYNETGLTFDQKRVNQFRMAYVGATGDYSADDEYIEEMLRRAGVKFK